MKPQPILAAALSLVLATACQNGATSVSVLDYGDPKGPAATMNTRIWADVKRQLGNSISVSVEYKTGTQYEDSIQSALFWNLPPDVVYVSNSPASKTLLSGNKLADLSKLLTPSQLAAFSPAALDSVRQVTGAIPVIPSSISATHVLYVNTELLKALGLSVPQTWDQWVSQVPKLRSKGLVPVAMGNAEPWIMSSSFTSTVLGRLAGKDAALRLAAGQLDYDAPQVIQSLAMIGQLSATALVEADSYQVRDQEATKLFMDQKAAYLISGDWAQPAMMTNPFTGAPALAPQLQKQVLMTTLPRLPGQLEDSPDTSAFSVEAWGISSSLAKAPEKQKAAIEVLLALQGPQTQETRYSSLAGYPTRADSTFEQGEPLASARVKFYQTTTASPLLSTLLPRAVNDALAKYSPRVFAGEMTAGQMALELKKASTAAGK